MACAETIQLTSKGFTGTCVLLCEGLLDSLAASWTQDCGCGLSTQAATIVRTMKRGVGGDFKEVKNKKKRKKIEEQS